MWSSGVESRFNHALVAAKAASHPLAREAPDGAADAGEVVAFGEGRDLELKPAVQHDVVGVHPGDQRCPAGFEAGVERRHQPFGAAPDQAHPIVAVCPIEQELP